MDDVVARLEADRAVRAFVADALERVDGDAEGAAQLMQLRLAQARREDARVLRLVIAEAMRLADAEQHGHAVALRERALALCDQSQTVIARGSRLRSWTTDALAAVHALLGAAA